MLPFEIGFLKIKEIVKCNCYQDLLKLKDQTGYECGLLYHKLDCLSSSKWYLCKLQINFICGKSKARNSCIEYRNPTVMLKTLNFFAILSMRNRSTFRFVSIGVYNDEKL